jgi:hypothetical protein
LHETKSGRCARWMAGAVNTIGQSKRGGGDRSSRFAQLRARENEKALFCSFAASSRGRRHRLFQPVRL